MFHLLRGTVFNRISLIGLLTQTLLHAHTHTHRHAHTHAHSRTRSEHVLKSTIGMCARNIAPRHRRNFHSHSNSPMHTLFLSLSNTYTHNTQPTTRTHSHMHTYTYTCTHTHTHVHTRVLLYTHKHTFANISVSQASRYGKEGVLKKLFPLGKPILFSHFWRRSHHLIKSWWLFLTSSLIDVLIPRRHFFYIFITDFYTGHPFIEVRKLLLS